MRTPRFSRIRARGFVPGFLAAAACAVAVVLASPAFACSCTEIPFETEYDKTEAVFTGRSLGQRTAAPEFPEMHYELFQVQAVWKGPLDAGVEVLVADSDGLCGFTLTAGLDYLVFARRPEAENRLDSHACSRTRLLQAGDPIFDLLGPPTTTPALSTSWGRVKSTYR